jgi:hypothetical protein
MAAYYYGNVPRHVFSNKSSENKVIMQLKALNVDGIANSTAEAFIRVNDVLVEYVPSGDNKSAEIRFRRGYVLKCLETMLWTKWIMEWDRIVRFSTNGHMFEEIIHNFMARFPQRMTPTDIKPLHPKGTPQSPLTPHFIGLWPQKWDACQFSSDSVVQLKTQRYYHPHELNFPVIDSFVFDHDVTSNTVHLLCFQMTMSQRHQTDESELEAFGEAFAERFQYDEHALKIEMGTVGTGAAQYNGPVLVVDKGTTKETMPLVIHLVYVVAYDSLNAFSYQNLIGQKESWYGELWDAVHQYKSGPPKAASQPTLGSSGSLAVVGYQLPL